MTKKLLIIILLLTTLDVVSASAAGLSVSPAKLDIDVGKNNAATLMVANPTADVQIFTVSADDFSEAINFQPASFTLESGGRKEVAISIDRSRLPNPDNSVLATNISVISKPLVDGKLAISSGVKIPLSLRLMLAGKSNTTPTKTWLELGAGFLALLVLAALVKVRTILGSYRI